MSCGLVGDKKFFFDSDYSLSIDLGLCDARSIEIDVASGVVIDAFFQAGACCRDVVAQQEAGACSQQGLCAAQEKKGICTPAGAARLGGRCVNVFQDCGQGCLGTCERGEVKILFRLGQASSVKATFMADLARMPSLSLHWQLDGSGARAETVIGYIVSARGQVQEKWHVSTMQSHSAQDTSSSVLIKGLVASNTGVIHDGMIKIGTQGTGTQARLQHTALVTHESAYVRSEPKLEVLAHEVACQHGAAVGYFDDEQRAYLQSRGLGLTEAHYVLLEGFFDHLFELDKMMVWRSLLQEADIFQED